ncbi:MAG: diaminopimelate epimerase [Fuerstiella sp.]
MNFIKMHGAGNDYVFIDGFVERLPTNPSQLSIRLSDRRLGVGADGLILMMPPEGESNGVREESADVRMRMWNADGSEGTMCGNAARCVAFWMHGNGRITDHCRIQMGQHLLLADVSQVDSAAMESDSISLTLPAPLYSGGLVLAEMPQAIRFSSLLGRSAKDGQLICHNVDCGNPHAVIFVEALSDDLVQTLGPLVENNTAFPGRTNVEFVCCRDRRRLEVRVWERGSGETLACGSGACAAVVSAISEGKCDSAQPISVCLPGGILTVTWPCLATKTEAVGFNPAVQDAECMRLTGPVCLEFTGTWLGRTP